MYDHGARNRNPVSTLWYGIDPLWEEHVSFSPFTYCISNPIRLVDLDGMDEYEVNPDGYVTRFKTNDKHIVYAVDQKGHRTGNSLSISDNKILDQLSNNVHTGTNKGDGTSYPGDYAISSNSEVGKVFTFMADNSNVEWTLEKFKNGKYAIGTCHEKSSCVHLFELNTKSINELNMVFDVHSHPDKDGTKGASMSSTTFGSGCDYSNIIGRAERFSKIESACGFKHRYNLKEFPKSFVYHRYTKTLYQYTPYVNSMKIGVVSNENIIKSIRCESKSSIYPK